MRLADLPSHGEWVLLGEDPPHEIAFGTIGRFWAGQTAWESIDAREFAAFDAARPCEDRLQLLAAPIRQGRTLVSYECRTRATDAAPGRDSCATGRPLSPFIGVVLRAQLGVVATELAKDGSRERVRRRRED